MLFKSFFICASKKRCHLLIFFIVFMFKKFIHFLKIISRWLLYFSIVCHPLKFFLNSLNILGLNLKSAFSEARETSRTRCQLSWECRYQRLVWRMLPRAKTTRTSPNRSTRSGFLKRTFSTASCAESKTITINYFGCFHFHELHNRIHRTN